MSACRTLCITACIALTCVLRGADPVGFWSADQAVDGILSDQAGGVGNVSITGHRIETILGVTALHLVAAAKSFPVVRQASGNPGNPGDLGDLGDGWAQVSLVADVVVGAVSGSYQAVAGRDAYGGPKGDVYSLVLTNAGYWSARIATTTGQQMIDTPATSGRHLLVLTYDGNRVRLLVDGDERGTAPARGPLPSLPDTPFTIGTYAAGQGRFRGGIVAVGLYKQALSEEELSKLKVEWMAARAKSGEDGFVFAQAADVHITDTRSVEILNDAVDRINADTRVAFSLWLGDLTRGATPDEMALVRMGLARLTQPRYVLRGNHDLGGGTFENEFGALHQVFSYGGWTFILADSNPGDKTPMAAAEREWIGAQLADISADTPIVFCTHHPLMPHTKHYLLAGADEILALFKEHNLKAVLSGHYHGNQEETVDGVLFTTTACCSSTRGNFDGTKPKGFRLFTCRDGTITTEFIPVRQE